MKWFTKKKEVNKDVNHIYSYTMVIDLKHGNNCMNVLNRDNVTGISTYKRG